MTLFRADVIQSPGGSVREVSGMPRDPGSPFQKLQGDKGGSPVFALVEPTEERKGRFLFFGDEGLEVRRKGHLESMFEVGFHGDDLRYGRKDLPADRIAFLAQFQETLGSRGVPFERFLERFETAKVSPSFLDLPFDLGERPVLLAQ
jgi:hypothetical protein